MSSAVQEPWALDLVDAARLVAAGELAPSELVASALERLEAVEPLVHAFVSVDAEGALREARAQDGQPGGPLRGIPLAVKDIFDLAGLLTGCGSAAYAGAAPAGDDATAVARLRAAGAIVVGKTATHELTCGVYTSPTRNPWDLERSAGGSSGGSDAAVAAGAAMGAIGSDTGGSIRIPASHCGLVGVKPTYDRVSRTGALTLSWSLDHVGPLARTADDAALLLSVLAGPDPRDPTTLGRPPLPEPLLPGDDEVRGLRVGVLRGAPFAPCEPDVESALDRAVALLATEPGSTDQRDRRGPAGTSRARSRAAAQARCLGKAREREAHRPGAGRLKRPEPGREAAEAPPAGHPARADRWIQAEYELGGAAEPVIEALVRTTAPFNLVGLPAVAVPTGLGSSGFPGSVQVGARPLDEQTALRLARAIERGTARPGTPRGLEFALANPT